MRQETITEQHKSSLESTVPTAALSPSQAIRLPLQQSSRAFTLAELVVSVGVLALLVFLSAQLLKSAANVATLGQKQMDADLASATAAGSNGSRFRTNGETL